MARTNRKGGTCLQERARWLGGRRRGLLASQSPHRFSSTPPMGEEMDACGRLSGEAGCAPCFSPDGRRWLDLDSGSRSAPDRAAGGKRRVPGQGARGVRRPRGAVAASRFGRRWTSPKPRGRRRDGGWGRNGDRENERGESQRGLTEGRFQVCDLVSFAFALW